MSYGHQLSQNRYFPKSAQLSVGLTQNPQFSASFLRRISKAIPYNVKISLLTLCVQHKNKLQLLQKNLIGRTMTAKKELHVPRCRVLHSPRIRSASCRHWHLKPAPRNSQLGRTWIPSGSRKMNLKILTQMIRGSTCRPCRKPRECYSPMCYGSIRSAKITAFC